MSRLATLLLAGALLTGCHREGSESEAPVPARSEVEAGVPAVGSGAPETDPQPPSVGTAGDAGEPSEEDVPVPEDFEEEAEQAITAHNYRAALDQLAAEIGAPESP